MSALFNPTVAWITLRATLSRKRALLFALPAVVLILLTGALRAFCPADAALAVARPGHVRLLGTDPADRADHRHERARRRNRRRQHHPPAGHAGPPLLGGDDEVRHRDRADHRLRRGPRADRRPDLGRR